MDGGAFIEPGRVGPNAVTQLSGALEALHGVDAADAVFAAAGCAKLRTEPPAAMVDEAVPAALFSALWSTLPDTAAEAAAAEAGRRTADYIIAHRIPKFAKRILKIAPRKLATRLLLLAIRRNAWTFAGSGHCAITTRPAAIYIADNPIATPDCVWHQAVFERLFRRLVDAGAVVRHTACIRAGAGACRFEIDFFPAGRAAATPTLRAPLTGKTAR